MAERSAKQLGLSQADLPNSVLEVIATLSKSGFEAYLVGGGVRDTLLGLNPKDFDAVTNAKPHEIKDLFGKRCRIIGRRFQLAHVYSGRDMIEVATFRAPPNLEAHTNSDGMIVRDNVWGDIQQDFARRDFTINSLYYQPIKGVVHDFCNALDDIKSKTLTLLGDAPTRIEEDPVRLLRALRFKAKLGFDFDKTLAKQFHDKNWSLLEQVSPHRLYDESQKMFTGGYLVPLLPLLFEYGAIEHLFIYPPKAPSALVNQVAINTDKRIAIGKSINPAFFYAALLWDNYLYQLAKFKKKKMPFQDAQLKAAAKVIDRQRIKTAIPRFAEQFIRDIWMLQPKLASPRAKHIYKLAEHPRFRAGFDFLLLREQCDDASNPLSESTNGMGAWWQHYQTLSDKQKQQAISDFNEGRSGSGSRRNRQRGDKQHNEANGTTNKHNDVHNDGHNDTAPKNVAPKHNSQQDAEPVTKANTKPTSTAKATQPAKSNKRTMSRPQRAHYNREREQLLKLSLEQGAHSSDAPAQSADVSISQPQPLFTIDADKLARQLPQGIAEQIVAQDSHDDLQDAKQNDKQKVEQNQKGRAKDGNKDEQSAKANTDAEQVAANQVANNHPTANKGPIPSNRRRRAPSSQITQIERLAQQSATSELKRASESTQQTAEPTVQKAKQQAKPLNTKAQQADQADGKQAQDTGFELTQSLATQPTATQTQATPTAQSASAKSKGRIPAIRRRPMPSSSMTVKERLAQSS